jgi:wobble nucleotide-excising tRNase
MLKSIQKIKGLGVFGDYAMPAGTEEFGVKNIIYGWNYSGKTTLSRLVAMLEHKRQHAELPKFTFSISTDAGVVSEANFQTCPQVVRVFNSDFVTDNLNFAGNPFKPILLLGADSADIQKKIEKHEKSLERISARAREKKKAIADAKTKMERAKTDKSAAIKTTLSLVKAYGSTQLEKDIQTVRNFADGDCSLTEEAYEADIKLARTSDQDRLAAIAMPSFVLNGDRLHQEAATLLGTKLDLANSIDYLLQHLAVETWVETGLELHKDKENCEFCGHELDAERMRKFKEHFSRDLAEHKQAVRALDGRTLADKVVYAPSNKTEFNAQFRDRFEAANKTLEAAIGAYNQAADALHETCDKKFAVPTVPLVLAARDGKLQSDVTEAAKALNAIIEENNKISNNFLAEKEAAINRLKLHFVQAFIKDQKLQEFEDRQERLSRQEKKRMACLANISSAIADLKALISQAQRGREEINEMIERLLGGDSVQISVTNVGGQERFQLIRKNGNPVNHLSEGEKTAIAFSFFVTSLQEIEDFKQAIVYIDDPISSLDSNHIFQVTAIIKETFFQQDPDQPDNATPPWITKCRQVFLSTHNFEFFSLLRELKPDKKKDRHYLVKKIAPEVSTFENMPKSMSKYASEYHFLFDVLNDFYVAPNKTDLKVLMLLPNAVRRFLELYTYSKYPGDKDMSVDSRAEILFGGERAKRILKVFHYFSHANNIERMAQQNDNMSDIEGAVKDLMVLLEEKDPLHLEALRAAVA